ncbi:MAG: metallophosphoesterase [bacterium]|nr:metallophosphoesterase [bacterium]
MRSLFPLIFGVVAILVIGLLELLLLRFLNRAWWQKKLIRRAAWSLPLFGVVMVVTWFVGEYYAMDLVAYPAAGLAMLTFILEVGLMLSLPLSGIVHLIQKLIDYFASRRKLPEQEKINPNRRLILQGAAAALPILTMTGGVAGMTSALGSVRVELKKISFPRLPDDLVGYRILHLSDLHLRHYVTLETVEQVLDEAARLKPNLILMTGDVADDLALLPDILKRLEQFRAPDGAYATLGNHEYFRGIKKVRNIYDRHTVPLFVDEATSIQVGATSLFIGGLDDPQRMGAKDIAFFERTIEKTLSQSGGNDFSILMSHRPDALDVAARHGVNLTLAGHTHGGQIGLFGRSAFESLWPDRYLWGEYRMKDSRLYTSAGMGHWFPFRLNCPAEAPVIELNRG